MTETGTVKWFSPRKGYGFILRDNVPEEEAEIFVHFSAIEMDGFKTLLPGLKVEYSVEAGRRDDSIEAKNVKIVNIVINNSSAEPNEEEAASGENKEEVLTETKNE